MLRERGYLIISSSRPDASTIMKALTFLGRAQCWSFFSGQSANYTVCRSGRREAIFLVYFFVPRGHGWGCSYIALPLVMTKMVPLLASFENAEANVASPRQENQQRNICKRIYNSAKWRNEYQIRRAHLLGMMSGSRRGFGGFALKFSWWHEYKTEAYIFIT